MNQSIKLIDSNDIRNSDPLARNETNDCVVRAFSSAFDLSYRQAHDLCRTKFGRRYRGGVRNLQYSLNANPGEELKKLSGKTYQKVTNELGRKFYPSTNKLRKKTIGTFIKEGIRGTFLVIISRHAFTIKDGVVIGNECDARRLRARIEDVYRVGA